MIFYHAFFLLSEVFNFDIGKTLLNFFMPAQPFFAAAFITLSGVSSRLSRSNLKRGSRLLVVSLLLTLVTAVILPLLGFKGMEIYFGILHFLSVSMIIYGLTGRFLDKAEPHWGILICVILYVFTCNISEGELSFGNLLILELPVSLYKTNALFPLGIFSSSFYSADYFAVFPNIFIFIAGTYIGKYAPPEWAYVSRLKFFSFLGRHSLIIYIAHQPVIMGIIFIIEKIIR